MLTEELQRLDQESLRRRLRTVEESEGARLTINGRELINFGSNNYMGLSRHPHVIQSAQQAAAEWGAGAASSRLISGNFQPHVDLESALADFLQREAALVFPSGYMANLAVIPTLVGPGDAIIMDRLCHASLIDAARLSGARLFVYRHADASDAERVLKRTASYRRRLLATESVFSMDGDFAPVDDLVSLARRYHTWSLIDDAHAIGVWREAGKGVAEGDIVVGTLSKSLGSQGGFVAASKEIIDLLVNKGRTFIFTTGLSPMCAAAAHQALRLIPAMGQERKRVQMSSERLRAELQAAGFDTLQSQSHIIPILLRTPERTLAISEQLVKAGVFAPAIRPPTVHAGECRIRFSITAEHSDDDIQSLLKALQNKGDKGL